MTTTRFPSVSFTDLAQKKAEPKLAFVTTRNGKVRSSQPSVLTGILFDKESREIHAITSDGVTRRCKIDRLGDGTAAQVEVAFKALWAQLSKAGRAKAPVVFHAAGGFSPDKWFCAMDTKEGHSF
jgi:hypothetical protein